MNGIKIRATQKHMDWLLLEAGILKNLLPHTYHSSYQSARVAKLAESIAIRAKAIAKHAKARDGRSF